MTEYRLFCSVFLLICSNVILLCMIFTVRVPNTVKSANETQTSLVAIKESVTDQKEQLAIPDQIPQESKISEISTWHDDLQENTTLIEIVPEPQEENSILIIQEPSSDDKINQAIHLLSQENVSFSDIDSILGF